MQFNVSGLICTNFGTSWWGEGLLGESCFSFNKTFFLQLNLALQRAKLGALRCVVHGVFYG